MFLLLTSFSYGKSYSRSKLLGREGETQGTSSISFGFFDLRFLDIAIKVPMRCVCEGGRGLGIKLNNYREAKKD